MKSYTIDFVSKPLKSEKVLRIASKDFCWPLVFKVGAQFHPLISYLLVNKSNEIKEIIAMITESQVTNG
jgi:hypothetical protein